MYDLTYVLVCTYGLKMFGKRDARKQCIGKWKFLHETSDQINKKTVLWKRPKTARWRVTIGRALLRKLFVIFPL